MGAHSLFPISVSNRTFSTENVKVALSKIPNDVTQIVFLIADWLQLYNRVRSCTENQKLGYVIKDYQERNKDLVNRQRWLTNFLEEYPDILSASPKIFGMEQYFDSLYAHTFRNINILHTIDKKFNKDINDAAKGFLGKSSKFVSDIAISLSEQYIIEEIALNIRIRVKEGLESEYYLGDFHRPMVLLYENCYSATIEELYGGVIDKSINYKFFSADTKNSSFQWKEITGLTMGPT